MSKHGENIRKRKDGRWEGRYIKGRKSNRTAIWGYIYGHSYAEVKKRLAIKKMEVQQFALNVENPTFFRAFSHLGKLHFLGVKTSTSAHYHYTLQHYILPVLGPYRVQALNESILENSILEIIAPADQNHKTLGNAMSKECLTLVRRICRYAVHLHIIADDIIVFVHLSFAGQAVFIVHIRVCSGNMPAKQRACFHRGNLRLVGTMVLIQFRNAFAYLCLAAGKAFQRNISGDTVFDGNGLAGAAQTCIAKFRHILCFALYLRQSRFAIGIQVKIAFAAHRIAPKVKQSALRFDAQCNLDTITQGDSSFLPSRGMLSHGGALFQQTIFAQCQHHMVKLCAENLVRLLCHDFSGVRKPACKKALAIRAKIPTQMPNTGFFLCFV